MPTIRDVAREAGVSIATVSRVVNRTGHPVNEQTRARVLDAVRKLDFHPSAVAKSLSTRKAQTVGVVIPDISNPYYAEIVRGIQDSAEEAGYTAILQNTDRSATKAAASVVLFREKLADGVIFVGGVLPKAEIGPAMGREALPGVVIGRQDLGLPSVQIDNEAAAADAVRHLASLGHVRVGFLAGQEASNTMQDRLAGYRDGLEKQGYTYDPVLVSWGKLTLEDGFRRAGALFESAGRPTALLAGNDQLAIGAIRAADEHGLRVPSDLAIVGFDNIPITAYFCPPLTTIDIPRYQMGVAAIKLLLAMLDGQKVAAVTWLPTRLIVRGSTRSGG